MSRIDSTKPSSFEPNEPNDSSAISRVIAFNETLSNKIRESPDLVKKAVSFSFTNFSFKGVQEENVVVAFAKMTVQTIGDCGVHI